MNSKLLNIIEKSDLLTQKELMDYASKEKLSKEQVYSIEQKIANNQDNQDLLDAFNAQPNLFKDFRFLKSPLDNNNLEWILVSFSVFVIFIGIVFFVKVPQKEHLSHKSNSIVKFDHVKIKTSANKRILKQDNVERKLFKINAQRQSSLNIERELYVISPIQSKVVKSIDVKEKKRKALKNTNKYPSIYLHDFKVTDYRKIRYRKRNETIQLSGTSASSEKAWQMSTFEKMQQDSVFYIDFLRETLRGFKHKKYSLIIPEWKKILNAYPDDDNALFYRAISNYKVSEYEASVSDLNNVLKNPMSNFTQESNWYLALNYSALGRIKESLEILDIIIEQDSFYAKSANMLKQEITNK